MPDRSVTNQGRNLVLFNEHTLFFILSPLFHSVSVCLSHETWLLITFGKTVSQRLKAIPKRLLKCLSQ